MIIKIKLVLYGIELIDFDTLPDNIKDAIVKILDFGKYYIHNNIIIANYDEEFADVIYILNTHFDLFIMKGE